MHVVFEWAERAKEDPNLEAELTGLHLGPSAGTSAWGTRYGPWATLQKEDGTQVFIPERARINAQMLGAWKQLARAAKHPYLRFRFADLVWDLATVASEKREVEFARLAADAALEGLRSGSFKFEVEAFKVCVRALELAKMINDDARGLDAERALFAYERSHGKDLHEATWGYALTRILDKESRLPPEEQAAVVLAMEERFARLLAMEPHPHTLQAAAVPLADLYRRQGRADDVARVLRAYANAVVALGRRMSGMLAASFLHRVHALLDDYGLREEAAALGSEMREQGQRSVSELKRYETTITIPAEEMAEIIDKMLAGSTDDALQRIAFEFIPADRGQLIEQVKKLAREAPLSAHLSKAFIDEDGQQVASVGSVDDDPDGNVIKHVEHWLAGVAPVLRIVLDAAQKRISLSADLVMSQVRLSFIFEEDKHPLVEEGLRAYFLGQYASAVHLLVPQIEAAIRQLAVHLQVMPYKRDGKNLELRSLGSLLGDPQLTKALTDRFSFYLQVLLTDERGWNLRNEVCHGMLSAQHFGPTFADRIIHVVIALTRIRRSN